MDPFVARRPLVRQRDRPGMPRSTRSQRLAAKKRQETLKNDGDDKWQVTKHKVKTYEKKSVNMSEELKQMMERMGEKDAFSLMAIIQESRVREAKQVAAQDSLIQPAMELRGESPHVCDIGRRNAKYFYNKGFELRCRGDFEEAIHCFATAVKLDETDFKAWFNLGFACDRTGNYLAAANAFRKSFRLYPQIPVSVFNLGIALTKLEKYSQAIKAFDQAILLDPTREEFHKARALAHRMKGDFPSASTDYVLARCIKPDTDCNETSKPAAILAYSTLQPFFFQAGELWQEPDIIDVQLWPPVDQILQSSDISSLEPSATSLSRLQLSFGKYEAVALTPPHSRTEKQVSILASFTKTIKELQTLPQRMHQSICSSACATVLSPEQHLFRVGEVSPPSVYIVLRGQLNLYLQPANAAPQDLRSIYPGESIGTLRLDLTSSPDHKPERHSILHAHSAVAVGETVILEVRSDALLQSTLDVREETTETIVTFLEHVHLFSRLSPTCLSNIAAHTIERFFTAGDVIVGQNHKLRGVFIIVSGSCTVTRSFTRNGIVQERKLNDLGPKDTFGESSLLTSLYQFERPQEMQYSPTLSHASLVANAATKVLFLAVSSFVSQTSFQIRTHLRELIAAEKHSAATATENDLDSIHWDRYKKKMVAKVLANSRAKKQLNKLF